MTRGFAVSEWPSIHGWPDRGFEFLWPWTPSQYPTGSAYGFKWFLLMCFFSKLYIAICTTLHVKPWAQLTFLTTLLLFGFGSLWTPCWQFGELSLTAFVGRCFWANFGDIGGRDPEWAAAVSQMWRSKVAKWRREHPEEVAKLRAAHEASQPTEPQRWAVWHWRDAHPAAGALNMTRAQHAMSNPAGVKTRVGTWAATAPESGGGGGEGGEGGGGGGRVGGTGGASGAASAAVADTQRRTPRTSTHDGWTPQPQQQQRPPSSSAARTSARDTPSSSSSLTPPQLLRRRRRLREHESDDAFSDVPYEEYERKKALIIARANHQPGDVLKYAPYSAAFLNVSAHSATSPHEIAARPWCVPAISLEGTRLGTVTVHHILLFTLAFHLGAPFVKLCVRAFDLASRRVSRLSVKLPRLRQVCVRRPRLVAYAFGLGAIGVALEGVRLYLSVVNCRGWESGIFHPTAYNRSRDMWHESSYMMFNVDAYETWNGYLTVDPRISGLRFAMPEWFVPSGAHADAHHDAQGVACVVMNTCVYSWAIATAGLGLACLPFHLKTAGSTTLGACTQQLSLGTYHGSFLIPASLLVFNASAPRARALDPPSEPSGTAPYPVAPLYPWCVPRAAQIWSNSS